MSENQTEAELESFRQKWLEEVSARTKGKAKAPAPAVPVKTVQASSSKSYFSKTNAPEVPSHARHQSVEERDGLEPVYQDLGGKQHGRRLDETSPPPVTEEPSSALEHYEKAVEKENQGSLGDSVNLYRKAFKVSVSSLGSISKNLLYYDAIQLRLTPLPARLQRPSNLQEQTFPSQLL
jgi:F-box protein 9